MCGLPIQNHQIVALRSKMKNMNKNRNIVILWIDEAPRTDFMARLETAGIRVFSIDNYVEGVEWLSNPGNIDICDAVILDVKCKIRHTDDQESTDSFRDYASRVLSRCESDRKHIPWFVFTTGSGYDESLLHAIPMREWTRKQYYLKDTDQQQLINDIRELTKHSENVRMREQFAGLFDLCDDEAMNIRLRTIIQKLEEPTCGTDTTIFNTLRKLMAFTVSYGKEHGLFSDEISSIREAQKRLGEIHELAPDIVPSYITTNYYALSEMVNNGSHSKYEESETGSLTVDRDVLSGDAPYLTRVAIFQMLTIFHWLCQLPTMPEEIGFVRKQIELLFNNPIQSYEGWEGYLQFDDGQWHYGRCVVREREGHPLHEQTRVRLKNVQANKYYLTKKQYPFYAQYEVVK